MTTATALVLLGVGTFGAALVAAAGQREPRGGPSLRAQADALRERAVEAQRNAARASHAARELTERWSAVEDAARRKEGR